MEYEFANPNIYQGEGAFERVNVEEFEPLSLRCPHCLHNGTFLAPVPGIGWWKSIEHSSYSGVGLSASIRVCPNKTCNGIVFVTRWGESDRAVLPPELLDFDATGLPEKLRSTLEEAIACHSVGAYRAAAMMVRRLLEELCDDSKAEGKTLHHRLEALRDRITLPNELFDAMHQLKALGNDAAHIAAKDFDPIEEEEAALSIELAKEILKARYQLKGLVERLRAKGLRK